MSDEIQRFKIHVSDADLEDLKKRLRATRWPDLQTVPDLSQGIPLEYVQKFCEYWARDYDWRRIEARLNALPQFHTDLDGVRIYFLHIRSPQSDAAPLILTHGWPGSVIEFLKVIPALPDPATMNSLTDEEKDDLAAMRNYQDWDSGYSKQQSTRPQTLGYGLADSPAGQAAWILEKFWAWTDCHGNPENALTRDEMLDDIMLYWLPNAAASSARLYWESFNKRNSEPVRIPVGCSVFPKEFFRASRRWAEKRYPNLVYWNRLDRGGHFAAFEQPDLFVKELRACFRKIRAM